VVGPWLNLPKDLLRVEPNYFNEGCFIEFEVMHDGEITGTCIMEVEEILLGDPRPPGHRCSGQVLEPEFFIGMNRGCSTEELVEDFLNGYPERFAVHCCGDPQAPEKRKAKKACHRCRGFHTEVATLHIQRLRLLERPIDEGWFEPNGLPDYKKTKGLSRWSFRSHGASSGGTGLGAAGGLPVVSQGGERGKEFGERLAESLRAPLPPPPPRSIPRGRSPVLPQREAGGDRPGSPRRRSRTCMVAWLVSEQVVFVKVERFEKEGPVMAICASSPSSVGGRAGSLSRPTTDVRES
jgi:hypothetical protein